MSYLLEKFKMKGKVMEVCDRYARNVLASLATVAHTGNYNDLSNKPTIPSAQVNSDWNASSGIAEILNKPNLSTVATSGSYNDLIDKPTIPTGQVNSDWNATSGVAEILNKPNLSAVATSGSYNDLSNTPNLSTVATSGNYNDLSNKPTIPTVNNGTLTIQKNGSNVATFTANQSGNATANITCENKISWTTSNNWRYYTDGGGMKHLLLKLTNQRIACTSAYGSLYYGSIQTVNFPIQLTDVRNAQITIGGVNAIMGANIQSINSTKIAYWVWSGKNETVTCEVYIDILST